LAGTSKPTSEEELAGKVNKIRYRKIWRERTKIFARQTHHLVEGNLGILSDLAAIIIENRERSDP
jgi:hypothetical protein